jgi:hypothetical protein
MPLLIKVYKYRYKVVACGFNDDILVVFVFKILLRQYTREKGMYILADILAMDSLVDGPATIATFIIPVLFVGLQLDQNASSRGCLQ